MNIKNIKIFLGISYFCIVLIFLWFFFKNFSIQDFKNYDLIYEQEINLYQYYYGDYFPFHLGDTDIMIKNSKNNTHTMKYLGLKDPVKNYRGDLYIFFKVNIDKHNLQSEEDKKLVEVLFN